MTANRWSASTPVALAICLATTSALTGADWNQWRGPHRDGVARQSPPLLSALPESGLMPVWVSEEKIRSARDGGWGSPILAQGRVYVFAHTRQKAATRDLPKRKYPWLAPDKRGHLTAEQYKQYEVDRRDEDEKFSKAYQYREIVYCLDARTGKTLWKNDESSVYTRFVQSGTLVEHGGRLLLQGADRTVRCVDAESGRSLWRTRIPGEFRDQFYMSSFAVADGVAVGLVGHLVGLDAESGKLLWQGDADTTKGTHASPIVWQPNGTELVIINVSGSETICVEPRTGRERWRVRSEAGHSTPVLAGTDRMITFGSSRKRGLRCFRISPTSAEYLWTYHGAGD
ncbi:MAG: PQQ-like beta-propeller repeat protein, partial [Phycisphaerae bacterium]|nr:PQQ-like beta-propeller repeat protein [Phycisphaerae bacterium]